MPSPSPPGTSPPRALIEALLALQKLDSLPRTGWIQAGVPAPESVAGHTLGVAHLVLALAPKETPALDLECALRMALLHDAPEALSGDLPRPASLALPTGAKASMEKALATDLLQPFDPSALQAYASYVAQASREARFVKACDRLQMGICALSYARAGQRGLQGFAAGLQAEDWSEFPTLEALWIDWLAAWNEAEPSAS